MPSGRPFPGRRERAEEFQGKSLRGGPVRGCSWFDAPQMLMKGNRSSRLCLGAVLVALMSAAPAQARWRRPQPARPPALLKPNRPPNRPAVRPLAKAERQDHLQGWMEHHKDLSVPDQMKALENEPGFRQLPPQTQQHYRDQLARLNNMTPDQRTRLLERNEMLENHTPEQREQFRQGMQQFNSLPQGRKLLFKRAFRDLREMSPAERQTVINSAPFRAQFSDGERNALTGILSVEPYPPIKDNPEAP